MDKKKREEFLKYDLEHEKDLKILITSWREKFRQLVEKAEKIPEIDLVRLEQIEKSMSRKYPDPHGIYHHGLMQFCCEILEDLIKGKGDFEKLYDGVVLEKWSITRPYENLDDQICKDVKTSEDWKELHRELVDRIIKFCVDHGIKDPGECVLNIDHDLCESVKYGKWVCTTDSYFGLEERNPKNPYYRLPILVSF